VSKEIKRLESRLTREQIEAAHLLAVNKFLPRPAPNISEEEVAKAKALGSVRLQLQDIAERVSISERQLYNWRTYNDDFIGYVNALASNAFMSHLPDIMEKHLDMTIKGQGSMKGIELFYKFGGLLIDKQEVKTEDANASQSLDERLERLKERAKQVEDTQKDGE
jgi:hypothetical protein